VRLHIQYSGRVFIKTTRLLPGGPEVLRGVGRAKH
jgi:hypothetical protein